MSATTVSNAAVCARKTTALTTSCESRCFAGRPCIAYGAAANTSLCTLGSAFSKCTLGEGGSCAYECFTNGKEDQVTAGLVDFSSYTFLIPFGDTVSNWENNWTANEKAAWEKTEDALADWTATLPSKSNNVLQTIEPLKFLNSTKRVTIAGGTSIGGQRGKVAKVAISTELLSSQTQLESLVLANLQLDQFPQSTFPTQLRNFSMVNCVTKEFPADLLFMTSLQVLDLSKNYFTSFPIKFSIPSVQLLNLSTNNLASFDGVFPNVTTLDLSGNTLTDIPPSVFAMSKLTALFLSANAFSNVVLMPEQVAFLQRLPLLSVDTFNAPSACGAGATQVQVGGAAVCVTSANAAGATTGGSGSSSHAGAIVGAIVGALVVLALVAGVVLYRRRKARGGSSSTKSGQTNTAGTHGEWETTSLWSDQELLANRPSAVEVAYALRTLLKSSDLV
ncbi:hypothetical protein PybrP1_009167 [[Pythium] brassicae (nom. inval.)]|nr:hypothetical protein PybrP1_009167 [[Pythium] brassicae (nom. inval.)]